MKTSNHKTQYSYNYKAIYTAVAGCLAAFDVSAASLPTNPHVNNGHATFTLNGNILSIANSPNTIINWDSFDIGKDYSVIFKQISSTSAVLNRDFSGNPSEILGNLSSNGKVFLINPAGVIFGVGSQIDTAGLVASSLQISDQDFLSGKLKFNADVVNPGDVVNNGSISGGTVYLIAPKVENNGIITTSNGETILAAGNSVTIVNSKDINQRVIVSAKTEDINLNQLIAKSGNNIFKVLNSGKIQANKAVVGENGKIYLRSAKDIETTETSVIEANGNKNVNGGYVQLLADGAGSYRGSVVSQGKSGGFIDTSAKYLDINELNVSTKNLSSSGKFGTWLLDPVNIEIKNSGTDTCGSGGSFSCNTGTSVILVSTLVNALKNSNVKIDTSNDTSASQADGNITVSDAITSDSTNSLTLKADNDIYINNNINIGGGLSLEASYNVNTNANIKASKVDISAGIDVMTNGSIESTAKAISNAVGIRTDLGAISINGAITSNNGDISIAGATGVNINSNIKSNGGDITVSADTESIVNIGALSNTNFTKIDAGTGAVSIAGGTSLVNIVNAGISSSNLTIDISGDLVVGDSAAKLNSTIDTATKQTISANNIIVKAGMGQKVSDVYSNAASYIKSKGSQTITANGELKVLGNSDNTFSQSSTNNNASISVTGAGSQTITARNIILTAGNVNGASAYIDGGQGNQKINVIAQGTRRNPIGGDIFITAGNASNSSAGIITGKTSTISTQSDLKDGDITLTGGNSASTNGSDFSTAYIGSSTQSVNLTLNAGNLTLNGGSVTGANPGAILGSIGKDATLKVTLYGSALLDASQSTSNVGVLVGTTKGKSNIDFNAADLSTTGSIVIGSKSATSGSQISITTDGAIDLGNNGFLGFSNGDSPLGNVTVTADSISGSNTQIYANLLKVATINGLDLSNVSNNVSTLEASNDTAGNIKFVNSIDLTIVGNGVNNAATNGSIEMTVTGVIKTGDGGIENQGSGTGSIYISGTNGVSIQEGTVSNVGTGQSYIYSGGNIVIGDGGIESNGNVNISANNITGTGEIDLGGFNTINLYASNNIGAVTQANGTTTYSPIYVNAENVYAYNQGEYSIIGNRSENLKALTMSSSGGSAACAGSCGLTDAVLFNYKDLTGTKIVTDAENLSILNRSGSRTYDTVSVSASNSDVLISGTGLAFNSSNIYSKSLSIVGSNISLVNSSLSVYDSTSSTNGGNVSLFGNNISLDNSYIFAQNNTNTGNVYFNSNSKSLSNLPGESSLDNLLTFASNSTIKISNRSYVYASNDIKILAGSLKSTGSGIQANHDVLAAVKNDLTVNGGDGGEGSYIYAGNEARFAVGGNLALNTSDSSGKASISAGSIDTIYLDFPNAGNFIVDGVKNAVSSNNNTNTGFFVGGNVAVKGDTLEVRYGSVKTTVEKEDVEIERPVINDILKSTKETNIHSEGSKVSSSKSTEETFFGNGDGSNGKNSNKKSQPKQCS